MPKDTGKGQGSNKAGMFPKGQADLQGIRNNKIGGPAQGQDKTPNVSATRKLGGGKGKGM